MCPDPPIGDKLREISVEELKVLQEADPTLKAIRWKENGEEGVILMWRKGLLYREGKCCLQSGNGIGT